MLADVRFAAGRSVAVLLLLLAMVLGGAIEAAACEPEIAIASASASFDLNADADENQPDGQPDQHGFCAHGHCHHGSQAIANNAQMSAYEWTFVLPAGVPDRALEPVVTDTPNRPPRA
ncbi:MAG TPA: hypothetical protein VKY80_11700 [Croceibacterium sp.]|nr:hypothetical protein [Croceibacterium sp.]